METAVDLDGNPRIWPASSEGTVDTGAYKYGSFHFEVAYFLPSSGDEGVEVSWNSRHGDTYTVWSSSDLYAWTPKEVVASQGKQTSWKDSDTTSERKYYRSGL